MPTFDVFLRIHTSSRDPSETPQTWGAVKSDERVARKSIIRAPGIISIEPGSSPAEVKWYPWTNTSAISGYRKLLTSTFGILDSTTVTHTFTFPPLDAEAALEEFATDQDDIENTQIRNSTMGFQIATKHTNGGGERNIRLYTRVYHRTSGGTETLLHTEDTEIGFNITHDVWHNFAFNVTLNTHFKENERLVIKYAAEDKGVPA